MIRQLIGLIWILALVGCSAIELGEQHAQATTQAQIAINSTVDSRVAELRADKPNLIAPDDNATLTDDDLLLEWAYSRDLTTDEVYQVQVAPSGMPLQAITNTQATQADIRLWIDDNPADSYVWQVRIMQDDTQIANPSDMGTFSVEGVQAVDVTATLEAIMAQATTDAQAIDTQIEETVTAILAETPTPDSESTAEATPDIDPDNLASSADISVYGTVPVDSDSLNSITALTFDQGGHLLVSLRAGEIYRLTDTDGDGTADETTLIFEDTDDEIGQVSGIFSEDAVLYVINGRRLSQLQDTDNDGIYETITHLTDSLPANQALLQASNSIIRSNDGRYFTADVNRGEILHLSLTE